MDGVESYGGLTQRQFSSGQRMVEENMEVVQRIGIYAADISRLEWVRQPSVLSPSVDSNAYVLTAALGRTTDRAMQLRFTQDGESRLEWFPRSACQQREDDPGTFSVAPWLAVKKGLTSESG
jgi:hypothetical protein